MSLPWRLDPTPLREAVDHGIGLWHASLGCPGWSSLIPLLSGDERSRAARFSFTRDARRYVVSHAVLRTVLGRVTGVAPEAVALRVEAGGRPVLGDGGTGLHVSLSRSEELVLVAVASRPLGVDLERLETPMDVEALAEVVFSPRERLAFGRVALERRREVLLRCWTRKEAILKATGQGLSTPPDAAEVLLTPSDATKWRTTAACLGACWQLDTVLLRLGYVGTVAYAVRAPGQAPA